MKKYSHCLKKRFAAEKRKQAEKGMDLWQILVLAVVRHAGGTNWDTLETWSNHHDLIRKVVGVHATAFIEDEKIEFTYQTILDNVSVIDEALLYEINLLLTGAGHEHLKKKTMKRCG
jgi:hypothetical protein